MDLLGRARKMIKGIGPSAPARPQYYSVSCSQGHPLRGLRTEAYQALRCPTCGEGIFVLPRSPLPEPSAPSARTRPAPSHRPDSLDDGPIPLADPPAQDADDVIWIDDEQPANGASLQPLSDQDIPPEYLPADETTDEEETYDEPEAEAEAEDEDEAEDQPQPAPSTDFDLEPVLESPGPEPEHEPEPEPARPPRRPHRRPAVVDGQIVIPEKSVLKVSGGTLGDWAKRHKMALTLTSVALLVLLTFAYRVYRQRWENLPHEAEVNWDEGVQALDAGEFDSAKRKLAIAARDFEALGITDERASQSRQLADEAAILADRASRTLEEIVEEAARFDPPDDWPRRFATIYRGQAVIIDSDIEAQPADSPHNSYELAYRVFVGRPPGRHGRIDLQGFQLFQNLKPVKNQRVVFGARLKSLALDGNEWVFTLEPDSGIIMTRRKALEKTDWLPLAGVPSDPDHKGRP